MHTFLLGQQSLINIHGWTLNSSWSDIKVETKNRHACFEINSVFRQPARTAVSPRSSPLGMFREKDVPGDVPSRGTSTRDDERGETSAFAGQRFVLRYTFFPPLFHAPNKMVRVIKGKLYRNDLKRNKNYFELKGGSNYRGFESQRVKLK